MADRLTDSTLVVAERFYDILHSNKAALGLSSVWFGDQTIVPNTPSLCVEPGSKRRELQGVPDRTLNTIETVFLLYHSRVGPGNQQTARRDCIRFAEAIERYLNLNHMRLFDARGDLITVHGYCIDLDPGYSYKSQRTLYNSVQMTWRSTTKTGLQVS